MDDASVGTQFRGEAVSHDANWNGLLQENPRVWFFIVPSFVILC
jgi:hypothetical protein